MATDLITRRTTSEFLQRFDSFCDSVLHGIEIEYRQNGQTSICVVLAARQPDAPQNDGWTHVRLEFDDVTEFGFLQRPDSTLQVLSDGLHISWLRDIIRVDFGWLVADPECATGLSASDAYLCAREASWSAAVMQPAECG